MQRNPNYINTRLELILTQSGGVSGSIQPCSVTKVIGYYRVSRVELELNVTSIAKRRSQALSWLRR